MKLTWISEGNCADGRTCPAKAATGRGTKLFIGTIVTDPEVLAQCEGRVGPGEGVFEVPDEVADAG